MRRARLSSLPLVALVAALLAGCGSGGSSSVTPSAYVSSICSAVAPFERDVLTRSSALDLTTVKSPAQGKKALQQFLTAISSDTDAAVGKLRSAGSPKVANGSKISHAILTAFQSLSAAMHRAVGQANALPTASTQAFERGAEALGNDVRTAMSGIGSNLQSSTLKSPDLQKAAASAPACKSING